LVRRDSAESIIETDQKLPYPRLRTRHRWRDRARLLWGLLLSLPLGVAVFGFILLLGSLPEGELNLGKAPTPVSLLQVPSQQWAANRQVGPKQVEQGQQSPIVPSPKPLEEKPPPSRAPGQIVDVAPTQDTDVPKDTQRVSEYNTHVTKETQARDKTAFYKNAMPKHTTTDHPTELPGRDSANKVEAVGDAHKGNEQKPQVGTKPGQKLLIPDVQKRDRLALSRGPRGSVPEQPGSEGVKGNSDRFRLQTGEGDGEARDTAGTNGNGAHLNLTPSQSVLDRIAGAPANDHLEGVEEGEGTFLNTREWKYAGFFNRVKQSVGEHWDPGTVMRRRDPSGQIYGWRDRRTVLTIVLDHSGGLSDLSVEKSCGVDFLDEEAMAAFRRAQPFSNPPAALLDEQGQVKFSFGFYLEMSTGGLHLFRSD
jgi:TonB family protein